MIQNKGSPGAPNRYHGGSSGQVEGISSGQMPVHKNLMMMDDDEDEMDDDGHQQFIDQVDHNDVELEEDEEAQLMQDPRKRSPGAP